MGFAALNFAEGISHKTKTAIMKLLLLTVFVAVASATDEVAEEAKPEAPKAVVPIHHPFYGLWGHQLNWPSISGPGFSSTCHGCRGKRSAEADAEPGHYGYYGYPYGYYGYPYFHPLTIETGYENDLPGDSSVSVKRTHVVGKRSAEPGYYGYPYGFYGYPYHVGYHALKPLKAGTAVHPGLATSFVERSPQGAKA